MAKSMNLPKPKGSGGKSISVPEPWLSEDEHRYPDESTDILEKEEGSMPQNHGFPVDPRDLLGRQLLHFEEMELLEEERNAKRGLRDEEGNLLDDSEDVTPIGEEEIEGNSSFSLKELISPLTAAEIKKAREKTSRERKIEEPQYNVSIRVFVFGGKGDPPVLDAMGNVVEGYDDSEDVALYQETMEKVLNSGGNSYISNKTIENIAGTSRFKVLLEVMTLKE